MDPRLTVNLTYEVTEFEDRVSHEIFFDPVKTSCCDKPIEKDTVVKLAGMPCPLCRGHLNPVDELEKMGTYYVDDVIGRMLISKPELYEDVHFNLNLFTEVVANNQFKTEMGKRFIRILEKASNRLNDSQEGKSAIEVLASTTEGRDVLRQNKQIQSLISDENKNRMIDGKTIAEWLVIDKELPASKLENEKSKSTQASQSRLFASPQQIIRTAYENAWKLAVVGNARRVKEMIEATPYLLLVKIGVIDYLGRHIENTNLLQVALRVGDADMCEIIWLIMLNSFPEGGRERFNYQFNEVFPQGYKKHIKEQQSNVFNFNMIMAAIGSATQTDLHAALSKRNNGSKLCRALDEFRVAFTEKSLSEIVFNPYHVQKAFDIYRMKYASWNQEKRNLFWRQVLGYTQRPRHMPPNYSQAFAQGIYYIVEDSEALRRSFRLRHDETIDIRTSDSASGLGYDYAICCAGLCAPTGLAMGSRIDSYDKFVLRQNSKIAQLKYSEDHAHSSGCRIM